MPERIPPYRPFFVTWDNDSACGHATQAELEELILAGRVCAVSFRGVLEPLELAIYRAKLAFEKIIHEESENYHASNKEIAEYLSAGQECPLSRAEVAKARDSLRKKLGFKAGW